MERVVLSLADIERKTTALMHSGQFLVDVGQACNDAYNQNLKQPTSPIFNDEDKAKTIAILDSRQVLPQELNSKLAPNLAGFYALQGTVLGLAADNNVSPLQLLEDIQNSDIRKNMGTLPQRAANIAWNVMNAMKGRETSENDVMVYSELSPKAKSQDMVQVQAVARVWYKALTTVG